MWKINIFEWWEKIQNKRYVVEINVVRLYLNTVLTPHTHWEKILKKNKEFNLNIFTLDKIHSLSIFCVIIVWIKKNTNKDIL